MFDNIIYYIDCDIINREILNYPDQFIGHVMFIKYVISLHNTNISSLV